MRRDSKVDVLRRMHERHLKASRKEQGRLLEEFVELTEDHRTYAQVLLKIYL